MIELKKYRRIYFSITAYIFIFSLLAIIPLGFTTYLSIKNTNDIQAKAYAETVKRTRAELRREIQGMGNELINIAARLSAWDETRTLFSDSTYYNYWKDTRTKSITQYRELVEEVDLYSPDGNALTTDYTLPKEIYPEAVSFPAVLNYKNKLNLVYFHPVQHMTPIGEKRLGYVGISMNLDVALKHVKEDEYSHVKSISWNLGEGDIISVEQAVQTADLVAQPSDEIKYFADIIRKGFTQYFLYALILVAFLILLFVFSIARPLGRLAGYLHLIYAGDVDTVPENFHGLLRIKELEEVRVAINDYKHRFQRAAKSLEEKNRELTKLTYHDPLTGRYNRRAFEARLEHAIETAIIEDKEHVLCYIDLDQFKVVNDTCGHVAGDNLLVQVAGFLEQEIREADMLARLGGDEFGVLLESCDVDNAMEIAESMRSKIKSHRFSWQNKPLDIGISIGLAPINRENANFDEIMKNADAACYVAKDSGRNRLQLYQEHDKEMALRYGEMHWVSRIKQALEENRFVLYAQLIRPVKDSEETFHYELLLRMLDGDGKLVPPMAFIPAAERYNLMTEIDKWVIENSMSILAAITPGQKEKFVFSINLSGQSIGDADILDFIRSSVSKYNIDPRQACFEITETAAITNISSATHFIKCLHELGCKFSLDDFGSGLSSFGYLRNLEVDYIKIDGEFIKSIETDHLSLSIVTSINEIGHVLGIETIAEFVENDSISERLSSMGIDCLQGFGIHVPEPLTDIFDRHNSQVNEVNNK